jgi:hypothetical protein
MNRIKRVLAILSAAAIVFTFAACQEEETGSDRERSTTTAPTTDATTVATTEAATTAPLPIEAVPGTSTFEQTRLYAATADIISSDRFYMRAESDGIMGTYVVAADGDKFRMGMSSDLFSMLVIVVDGKAYFYDNEHEIWHYTEADEQGLATLGVDVSGVADMFDVGSLVLTAVGIAEFMGRELYFEEFEDDDTTVRYFFDGNTLVGVTDSDGDYVEITLTTTIPAGLFDVPADAMTLEEYTQFLIDADCDDADCTH